MSLAVEISVGSLSPTINWKTLATQQFSLPPIDEQQNLVEVLQAMEDVIEVQTETVDAGRNARSALVEDELTTSYSPYSVNPLGTYLIDLSYGSSSRSSYDKVGYPILRIPNVLRGRIDYSDIQYQDLDEIEYERFALKDGDVLLVRTNGNPQYVGRSVVIEGLAEKTVCASYLIRIRCDENRIRPAFLAEFLNAPSTRQRLRGEVKSSAGNFNINTAGIRKQPICVPRTDRQDAMLLALRSIDQATESLESRLAESSFMKKKLLNDLWSR